MSSNSNTSESKVQIAKAVIAAAGSLSATALVARTIMMHIPDELPGYLFSSFRYLFSRFSSEMTLVVDEFNGIESNHVYSSATLYLGSKSNTTGNNPRRLKINRTETDPALNVTVDKGEPIYDYHDGVWYTWILFCKQNKNQSIFGFFSRDPSQTSESKSLELTFNKKHKDKALNRYIQYVIDQAKKIKEEQKTISLYTVNQEIEWTGLNLNHPATFETIAMDLGEKQRIMEDLERFVRRKEYYKKVGKAWKRGYLLYGPPGTGKSSLIAAIANFLRFNVYDLDLAALKSNSDLRTLLLATENRSILVIEDIDCTANLKNREADSPSPPPAPPSSENPFGPPEEKMTMTLSGFLNFIDGLWSSCGDERIIIFTTNYKEKLDPALLRPGRMDMHILMSYCTRSGFITLARNYLGVESHELFKEIMELIERVHVTPAEVAEQLMREDDPRVVLEGLITFLNARGNGGNDVNEK